MTTKTNTTPKPAAPANKVVASGGNPATGDNRPVNPGGVPTAADTKTTKAPAVKVPAGPSRKNVMAREMAAAISAVSAKWSESERLAAANMIHHFPTGKDESGKRVWPAGFPRPARSDWA